jgi:polyribonucleotide nucleotidyltransferase
VADLRPLARASLRSRGPRCGDCELQDRRSELQDQLDTTAPTEQQLADAREHIRDAIGNGDDKRRKHLLQALVAEIRIDSREQITPVYRVPHAQQVDTVRAPETLVDLPGHYSNLTGQLERLREVVTGVQPLLRTGKSVQETE